MSTRHVSAENDYPFVPALGEDDQIAVGGILDVYFVIQGDAGSDSSSDSSSQAKGNQAIFLESWTYTPGLVGGLPSNTAPGEAIFLFRAYEDDRVWDISFTVPMPSSVPVTSPSPAALTYVQAPSVGRVFQGIGTGCSGVLLFNSDMILTNHRRTGSAASAVVSVQVEPARAQWHTEQVSSIALFNTYRCGDTEDFADETLVADVSSSLDLADGYNCELSVEEGVVQITALREAGLGLAPELAGNADACALSEADVGFSRETISVVNGVVPTAGNIVVEVSKGFGKRRTVGKLELIIREL